MATSTFSLEQIRLELARLGYTGLSKQTLSKFQADLEELAQNDKNSSKEHLAFVFVLRLKSLFFY